MVRTRSSVVIAVCVLGWSCVSLATALAQNRPPTADARPPDAAELALKPTSADWDWYGEHKDQALEALMPLKDFRLVIGYRSFHDNSYSVLERYFGIGNRKGADGYLRDATVVVPVELSTAEQLLRLHMADRSASFDTVLARIKVRRMTFTEATCPAISTWMERLSTVSVRMPNFGVIDFPIHRVWHRVVTYKVDATVGDPASPLGRWATGAFDALWACGVATEK
jgi:hypothetical protein